MRWLLAGVLCLVPVSLNAATCSDLTTREQCLNVNDALQCRWTAGYAGWICVPQPAAADDFRPLDVDFDSGKDPAAHFQRVSGIIKESTTCSVGGGMMAPTFTRVTGETYRTTTAVGTLNPSMGPGIYRLHGNIPITIDLAMPEWRNARDVIAQVNSRLPAGSTCDMRSHISIEQYAEGMIANFKEEAQRYGACRVGAQSASGHYGARRFYIPGVAMSCPVTPFLRMTNDQVMMGSPPEPSSTLALIHQMNTGFPTHTVTEMTDAEGETKFGTPPFKIGSADIAELSLTSEGSVTASHSPFAMMAKINGEASILGQSTNLLHGMFSFTRLNATQARAYGTLKLQGKSIGQLDRTITLQTELLKGEDWLPKTKIFDYRQYFTVGPVPVEVSLKGFAVAGYEDVKIKSTTFDGGATYEHKVAFRPYANILATAWGGPNILDFVKGGVGGDITLFSGTITAMAKGNEGTGRTCARMTFEKPAIMSGKLFADVVLDPYYSEKLSKYKDELKQACGTLQQANPQAVLRVYANTVRDFEDATASAWRDVLDFQENLSAEIATQVEPLKDVINGVTQIISNPASVKIPRPHFMVTEPLPNVRVPSCEQAVETMADASKKLAIRHVRYFYDWDGLRTSAHDWFNSCDDD